MQNGKIGLEQLREKFQGVDIEWIVFDEVADMANFPEPYGEQLQRRLREEEEYCRSLLERRPGSRYFSGDFDLDISQTIRRPTYTQTAIKPPPEFFCIQYIGGPKNSMQDFLKYRENFNTIKDHALYRVLMSEPLRAYDPIDKPATMLESFTYNLTLIPLSETPFSDAQIVIALFQP